MESFSIFVLLVFLLAIILLFMGVKSVQQGMEWTIERFGRYTHTLKPGLNIIIPFVDRVGNKISMRETVFNVPSQDVITKDNAMVRVDGVVFYQIIDAARAAYEVSDVHSAVTNLTVTNIRTVMGAMDLDELLSNRERINASLLRVVDEATRAWGIKMMRIEIKDITPPKDLIDSMARQMKAERDKRASILEAEGSRQAAILEAEGEKQARILEAEGNKEAEFRTAEARERLAQAEAAATQIVSQAIHNGSAQALNYFVAQKYIEALKALASAPNQKVLLMPLEATSLIGAISGIAEITKDAFMPASTPHNKSESTIKRSVPSSTKVHPK
ncbi:MAG: SPFH domain-containing protein [Janthinobacterium lividum]